MAKTYTTTFTHSGTASGSSGSDNLCIRVTWTQAMSGSNTVINITKVEIKDDGISASANGNTGYVELGITVGGARVINASSSAGTWRIKAARGSWVTVVDSSGTPLTGSGSFVTPSSGSASMVLSNSTAENYAYPAVNYSSWGTYSLLKTNRTQTVEILQGAVNVGNRKGMINIYHNGQWRVGIPKVWDGSKWRIGG